jgi:tetratricopeptide (TPR) repeat protein
MADLGVALLVLGKFEEAHIYLKEASKVHQELDNFEDFLFDTIMLCWTKLSMGQYSQAWDRVQYAVDWCHGKVSEASEAQASSVQSADLSSVRLDRYEPSILGQALSVQGAASMALGRLTDAEHSLQGSIAAFQKTHTMSASVHPYSDLGALYIKIGQPARARKYLHCALKMGVEINSAMSQVRVLSEASLILAEEGDLERAIEIYALASRYLWIGESQWHHDVIEHPLDILTSSLPEEVIEAAQKRGRERDLEGTVQELLAELA